VQDKLLGIAKSKGYDTLPVVKDAYKNLNEYILLKYKNNEIADRTEIPDSLIHNYYKENLHLFSSEDELNVQEIIVTDESLADSIKLILDNGGEFGELAKQYSLRKWSAENNGVMGYAPLSKFGMLKEKFWNSPISKIIGPIAIGNIYGLFKVLDRKPGKPKDFNITKDQVEQALKLEQRNKIIMDYIENLWKKVNIQVDESTLTTYKF
jgi:foldase protein PrsA